MSRFLSWITLAFTFLAAATAEAEYPLWARTSIWYSANIFKVVAADFNSDGRPDVVTRNSSQVIHLYLMTGDEWFPAPETIHLGDPETFTDLLAADVTGDGKADVILSDSATDVITVLPSNGDGTFGTPIHSPVAVDPVRLAKADFNSDGKLDLAVCSTADVAVALYAGNGAGSFSLLLNRSLTSVAAVVEAGDIDADGKGDYVVGYSDGSAYEVHFGNGDGTFAPFVPVTGLPSGAFRMALADLDADGDLELVIPHYNENTFSIVVNNGSRTFASPVSYPATAVPSGTGNPAEVIVGDVNGDANADVVMTLTGQRLLATYTGNGDGSLNAGVFVPAGQNPSFPLYLAAADFSGDGRFDLALGANTHLELWKNVSGDVSVWLFPDYPTITEGQTAKYTVNVENAQADFAFLYPPPAATGTVTLKRNDVEVGSGPLVNGVATIEVPSLPIGTHAITAHYSGDDNYRATVSYPADQHVIEESTAVSLTSSAEGTEVPYGDQFSLTATVTSEVAGAIDGVLKIYVDGQFHSSYGTPVGHFHFSSLSPGSHTFHAEYGGSATHPPSTSQTITQVVRKAETGTDFQYTEALVRYGQQPNLQAAVSSQSGPAPSGNVHLYEGSTLLATVVANGSCCIGAVGVSLPVSLPIGIHYIHAVYEGNQNFESSTSDLMEYVVFPDDGFVIDAWLQGSEIVVHTLYEPPSGGVLKIWRRVGTDAPTFFPLYAPRLRETSPETGTPYVYRMEAYDASNQLVATSNTVLEMLFTDEPLQAGTVIKSVHLTELVAATNALRSAAGLGAIAIDASAGQIIRATHVLQLRTAINEARVALGAGARSFSPDVGAGLPMKALHIQELRDAIH